MTGLRERLQRPEHGRVVEALADLPRLLLVTHRTLEVAPGHVEADRVTEDQVERALRRDVSPALRERRDQLDLVVVILGERRIRVIDRHAGRRELDRIGRLLEEERRLARRVRSHLARVRRVVAADAVDPPHRELLIAARDRNEGLGNGERHAQAPCALAGSAPAAAPPATIAAAPLRTSRRLIDFIASSSLPTSRVASASARCDRRATVQPFRFDHHAPSSPTMPRRNASTQTTKMAPVMTVTHWPNTAR